MTRLLAETVFSVVLLILLILALFGPPDWLAGNERVVVPSTAPGEPEVLERGRWEP
jgi:hypothetical protein